MDRTPTLSTIRATGRVWIDTRDTDLFFLSYVIGAERGFQLTNHESHRSPFYCMECFLEPFQVGSTSDFDFNHAGPIWYSGQLFPTDMSLEEVDSFLSLAEYASDFGIGGVSI